MSNIFFKFIIAMKIPNSLESSNVLISLLVLTIEHVPCVNVMSMSHMNCIINYAFPHKNDVQTDWTGSDVQTIYNPNMRCPLHVHAIFRLASNCQLPRGVKRITRCVVALPCYHRHHTMRWRL